MSTLETLKAVKALIEDPKHWAVGALARSAKGRVVNAESPKATCFCIEGAFRRVTGETWSSEWVPIVAASRLLYGELPYVVNDDRGHDAVMAVLDAAIAEAEKAG